MSTGPIHRHAFKDSRLIYITTEGGVDIWFDPDNNDDGMPYMLEWGVGVDDYEWFYSDEPVPISRLPLDHPAVVFTTNLVALSQ